MELQSQLKILIVEDDVLFNKFYLMFLEERQALCTSCLTIAAAEQWLGSPEAQQVDVILLDNHLADGEGIALLPQIKQQAPLAAVIMVSGNEDPDFFLHAFANGIDDYVVKPLNLHLLQTALHQSIRGLQFGDINSQQLNFILQDLHLIQALLTDFIDHPTELSLKLQAALTQVDEHRQQRNNPVSSSSMASGEVELF